jgi:putative spermidine/putrescine transport system ATP-binding protein
MVFQNYALFPHMTVRENIAFPLKMRRMHGKQFGPLVDEALRVVQLDQHHDRYPNELSGGQQQRVALARATVYRPSLLLMDEPLSALDRKLRLQMQYEIKRLHSELGTSVIYVTHDQEEALGLSDRIALMRDGRLEQVDTPERLYRRPKSAFSAWFLGESNFLDGTAVNEGAEGAVIVVELADGSRVAATASCAIPAWSKVRLAVRPEHLQVACQRTPTDGSSPVEVLLEESVYQGSSVRCHGRFSVGGDCTIRTNGAKASEILDARTVWVTWQGAEATAFLQADEALGPQLP